MDRNLVAYGQLWGLDGEPWISRPSGRLRGARSKRIRARPFIQPVTVFGAALVGEPVVEAVTWVVVSVTVRPIQVLVANGFM